MNKGNQGAEQLVTAICKIADGQVPKSRQIDFGVVRPDYSLVTDSFPVPIPRGEWSAVRHLAVESIECPEGMAKIPWKLQPGDRVVVVWSGNEAVVVGSLTRL